jgi:cardiolipin synthase
MLPRFTSHGLAVPGNKVRVFRNGDESFPAMVQAIRSAERYVCLETYILRDDKTGWEFAAALADRARHGVEVSLLYDSFGSFGLGAEYRAHLQGNGVRLYEYHPVMPWRRGFDLNRRDHRKQLIVDGEVGFVGGINIADEYRKHDGEPAWRDTHLELRGPAVRQMLRLFSLTWLRHGGAPMHSERYRHVSAPVGDTSVKVLGNRKHADRGAIKRAYLEAFDSARKKILITNSYFVPDADIRVAMQNAARRGVRVALLLAGKTDVQTLQFASRHYYHRLLDDGLEMYEWTRSTLHAKTAVVDDLWSTVGSYNLNWRSLFHNLECNVFATDNEVAAEMERMFWADVALSKVIDHEFIHQLTFADRMIGTFTSAFRYWL